MGQPVPNIFLASTFKQMIFGDALSLGLLAVSRSQQEQLAESRVKIRGSWHYLTLLTWCCPIVSGTRTTGCPAWAPMAAGSNRAPALPIPRATASQPCRTRMCPPARNQRIGYV